MNHAHLHILSDEEIADAALNAPDTPPIAAELARRLLVADAACEARGLALQALDLDPDADALIVDAKELAKEHATAKRIASELHEELTTLSQSADCEAHADRICELLTRTEREAGDYIG